MTRSGTGLETDVAIVGAGPVGLCLALELGSRNVDCVVVEQRPPGRTAFPTANHISLRTMEHLRRHGLAGEVARAFPPGHGHWIALTCLGGHEVARVEYALAQSVPGPDSPERETWAPKPVFDPILRHAAESHPSVRWLDGTRFVSQREEAGFIHCNARRVDGTPVEIRARHLVGCDGAASSVRESCGIEMVGPDPLPIRVHSAFFRSACTADLVPSGGVQYSLLGTPSGPTPTPVGAGILVSVDGHALWRLHGPGLDADDERATLARLRALGAEDAEILAMTAWTPAQALCTDFRAGRILLAGDAAHVVTPFGGLGVNTGMADAVDLGWKLAATLAGWGGPRLLEDSYDFERRAAARALLAYQGVEFGEDGPKRVRPPLPLHDPPTEDLWRDGSEGEAARRRFGASLVASRGDEYEKPGLDLGTRCDGSPILVQEDSTIPEASIRTYEPTTRPGGRAPHVELGRGRSTLDLFGPGFTLVTSGHRRGDDGAAFERAARRRGMPLRTVTLRESIAFYRDAFTLVRPDGIVAWRGREIGHDVDGILDRARGA